MAKTGKSPKERLLEGDYKDDEREKLFDEAMRAATKGRLEPKTSMYFGRMMGRGADVDIGVRREEWGGGYLIALSPEYRQNKKIGSITIRPVNWDHLKEKGVPCSRLWGSIKLLEKILAEEFKENVKETKKQDCGMLVSFKEQ